MICKGKGENGGWKKEVDRDGSIGGWLDGWARRRIGFERVAGSAKKKRRGFASQWRRVGMEVRRNKAERGRHKEWMKLWRGRSGVRE